MEEKRYGGPQSPSLSAYVSKEMHEAFVYFAKHFWGERGQSDAVKSFLMPGVIEYFIKGTGILSKPQIQEEERKAMELLKKFRQSQGRVQSDDGTNLPETVEVSYTSVAPNSRVSEVEQKVEKLRTIQKGVVERGARKNSNSKTGSKTG